MKTIGERKPSFEEFQEEMEEKIKHESLYVKKILFYAEQRKLPIEEKIVLYQGRSGDCLDETTKNMWKQWPIKDGYQHIWSVENPDSLEDIPENIILVKIGTKEWFHYLATAKYLVTYEMFSISFVKRKEQVLICTAEQKESKDELTQRLEFQMDYWYQDGSSVEGLLKQQSIKKDIVSQGKKKLLFIANGKMDLGQLITMLDEVDFSIYDVTLTVYQMGKDDERLAQIHPDVRVIEPYGRPIYTKDEYIRYLYLSKYLFYANDPKRVLSQELNGFLETENQRIYGDTIFDYMIVYGEFFPRDYVLFHKIPRRISIYIQNFEIEKMKRNWRQGRWTGIYTEFAIENRIRIMKEFDQVFCLSKGLLHMEKGYEKYSFYKEADFIKVREDKTRKRERSQNKIVSYDGKEYYAYKITQTSFLTKSVTLLPAVPKGMQAWVYILDDLSGNSLETILKEFQKNMFESKVDMLFIIDNFDVIDKRKKISILVEGSEERVIILQDIDIYPEYMEQFAKEIRM